MPARDARGLPLEALGHAADLGALAHYGDPAYYDKTYRRRTEDVDYYVKLARLSGGPVLEYGTGSGRIGLPIARAGVELVGIDLSRPMLASFQDKLLREPADVARRVKLVRGDMRRARLRRRFPLVIAPFNVVLHLYERRDVEQFLACVRAHLTPRGRFVLDFSLPAPADLARDPERHFGAPPVRHPSTGQLVHYDERFEYDGFRQVLLVWMRFKPEAGQRPWLVPLTHRQFFPREMEALLHYNGFTDLVWSKDFGEAEADAAADSVVVSARARSVPKSRARGPAKAP